MSLDIGMIAKAEFYDDSKDRFNHKCRFTLSSGKSGITNLYDQNVNLFLNLLDSEKVINNSSVFKKVIQINEEQKTKANEILSRVFDIGLQFGDSFRLATGNPCCQVDCKTGEVRFWK